MAASTEDKSTTAARMKTGKKREANYELLRITAMFMVVCLHYLSHAGALTDPGKSADGTQILGDFLEALCIVAVNVYVLITGWFQSQAEFHGRKLIRLIAEILFYTLLIPAGLSLLGTAPAAKSVWDRWFWFFPVSMEAYWFITAYVILYLFSPFLNAGLRALPRKQAGRLILILLFFFCFLPSVSPVKLTIDRAGYDFVWFAVLYLIGGYLRRYGCPRLEKRAAAAGLYFGSASLLWVYTVMLHLVSMRGALLYYADVPYHYNFLLTLTASLGLFYWFRGLHVPEGKATELIRRAAPSTLGVYLIHENIDIRDRWLPWMERFLGPVPQGGLLVLHMLVCAALLYICCTLLDVVRRILFARCGQGLYALSARRHGK